MKYIISTLIVLLVSCQRPTRVVFLGDSITEMGDNKEGEGIYEGFISSLRNTFEDHDIELINKGVGGDKVTDLLVRYDRDVLQLRPDIVFIYIGINDVWHKYDVGTGTDIDAYENGLRKIIQDIKAHGAKIILCTPTVIGENQGSFALNNHFKSIMETKTMNDDLDAFAQVMGNLSQEFSVELLDLRSIFLDYISKNNSENKPFDVLTYDGVHLNSYGNQIIADQMAKFIRRSKN